MRLSGGRARGRRLRSPRIEGLRPTSARLRKALFDILGARIAGAAFLDVFAGSGAIGLDALSRGAAHAVFVESDRQAALAIERNIALLDASGLARVVVGEANRSLALMDAAGERFDVIFLDPPYAFASLERTLASASRLLRPGAVLVVEHAARRDVGRPDVPGLRPGRRYLHGDSALTVMHFEGAAPT